MGVTLERVQNKFACIIGELCNEPYVLSQFAIWVDLRIAEYKAHGNISLDCSGTSDSPVWLIGLNPPKAVQSEPVLQRYHRLSANRNDRLSQNSFKSSSEFSSFQNKTADFTTTGNSAVTVKEEPDVVQGIFPVSLHHHDRLVSDNIQNNSSRKRTSDQENSTPQNKFKKMSGDVIIDSVNPKDNTEENQSLMSVIGHDHVDMVNLDSEDNPPSSLTQSIVNYGNSQITDNSVDGAFNISSSSAALSYSDLSPSGDRKDSEAYQRTHIANGRMGYQELKGGTLSNTRIALSRFKLWLSQNSTEERPIEEIPPTELDAYLVPFYTTVTQIGGRDYSKRSLQSLRERIERHLKLHDYPTSILRSPQFAASQNAFKKRCLELEKAAKSHYHLSLNKT